MDFKAPNSAYNISVADAEAFLSKMRKLGFSPGDVHANGQSSAEQADYVPVADLSLVDGDKYNLVAFCNGGWHNVAFMKAMFGTGSLVEFGRLAASLGYDETSAKLNIPGAGRALEALIRRA